MIHLLVVLPFLAVFLTLLSRLTKKHPKTETFRYFRNFIFIWLMSTIIVGIGEEALAEGSKEMFNIYALTLPLLYVAFSYLIHIPSSIDGRNPKSARFASVFLVVIGILFSFSLIVAIADLSYKTGPLQPFFTIMSNDFNGNPVEYYDYEDSGQRERTAHYFGDIAFDDIPVAIVLHKLTVFLIFSLIGLFFVFQILKMTELKNKIRSFLIGFGLVVVGIAESIHSPKLDSSVEDLFLISGFILIVAGIFYTQSSNRPVVSSTNLR